MSGVLGAVLAGGKSSRMGTDKAGAVLAGKTLLERSYGILATVFPRVVIVGHTSHSLKMVHTIVDIRRDCGPLGGLHAALTFAQRQGDEGVFLLACDMPFVRPAVVRMLTQSLSGYDAAAPLLEGRFEPLCAAYAVSCLPTVSKQLKEGMLDLQTLLAGVRTRAAQGSALRRLDPLLDSFRNINTAKDLKDAALSLGG